MNSLNYSKINELLIKSDNRNKQKDGMINQQREEIKNLKTRLLFIENSLQNILEQGGLSE